MADSTRELSFLFILLGVSAMFYATLIYLIENPVLYEPIYVIHAKNNYVTLLSEYKSITR